MDLRMIVTEEDVKQLLLDDIADRAKRLQVDQPNITGLYCPDGFDERFSLFRSNMDRTVARIEASKMIQSEKNAIVRELFSACICVFNGLFTMDRNEVRTAIRSIDQFVVDAEHHVSRLKRIESEDHALIDPQLALYGIVYHRRWERTAAELIVGPPIALPLHYPRILIVISYLEAKDFYDCRKAAVVDQKSGDRILKCINLLSPLSGPQKLKGFELVALSPSSLSIIKLMEAFNQVKNRYPTLNKVSANPCFVCFEPKCDVFTGQEDELFKTSVRAREIRFKNRYNVSVIESTVTGFLEIVSVNGLQGLVNAYLETVLAKTKPKITFVDAQIPKSGYYCSSENVLSSERNVDCQRLEMPKHYLFWMVCRIRFIKEKYGCDLVMEAHPKSKFMAWILFEPENRSEMLMALEYLKKELPMCSVIEDEFICTACLVPGHKREDCRSCTFCSEIGHIKPNCNEATIEVLVRERAIQEYISFMDIEIPEVENYVAARAHIECCDGLSGQNFFEGFPCTGDAVYGLDCEMARAGVESSTMKAIAVAVVRYNEKGKLATVFRATIFQEEAFDTVSWVSGIHVHELFYGLRSTAASWRVSELLRDKTVFVAGNQDMNSLGIDATSLNITVVDLLMLHEHKPRKGPVLRPSLAALTFAYTGRLIHYYSRKLIHSCVEDAEHALSVGLQIHNNPLTYEQVVQVIRLLIIVTIIGGPNEEENIPKITYDYDYLIALSSHPANFSRTMAASYYVGRLTDFNVPDVCPHFLVFDDHQECYYLCSDHCRLPNTICIPYCAGKYHNVCSCILYGIPAEDQSRARERKSLPTIPKRNNGNNLLET
ncbi:hypothetical protein HDE_11147 [Halotydeus destructor]|nr:hypothetical protein HDE_11147 [Halotydeus destructor]